MRTKPAKGGRKVPPRKIKYKRNSTELKYENEILVPLQKSGILLEYYYESWNFRLADRSFYLPDYVLIFEDRIEIHEVKGFWTEPGRTKWKVAADKYPWFVWKAVQFKRGKWITEVYGGSNVKTDGSK